VSAALPDHLRSPAQIEIESTLRLRFLSPYLPAADTAALQPPLCSRHVRRYIGDDGQFALSRPVDFD